MAASGQESKAVPLNGDGRIIVAQIDWDALISFIERLIPLIAKLLEIFAGQMASLSFALVYV